MNQIEPSHYKDKPIETIEAIKSQLSFIGFIGYLIGSALKYLCRMGVKYPTLQGALIDAKKSEWFIKRIIKELEEQVKQHGPDQQFNRQPDQNIRNSRTTGTDQGDTR